MDEPIGFLESELERAVVTMSQAPAEDNVVQISDSLRSQATLRERERRFRGLLDALPAAVYTTDAAGRITYYNDAAAELWGYRPPLGTSEWCGSWKLFWPDGTPRHRELRRYGNFRPTQHNAWTAGRTTGTKRIRLAHPRFHPSRAD